MDATWTGKISFGFVFVPVALYSTLELDQIECHLYHKKCGNRDSNKKYCSVCNEDLQQEAIERRHYYINEKYITLTDEEMKSAKTSRSKSIVLDYFIKPEEIKPQSYNKSYLVVPTGGDKAFKALMDGLRRSKKVGIAKTTITSKETLLALQVVDDEMLAFTLHYAEEIRKSLYTPQNSEITETEVDMIAEFIRSKTKEFKYEEYHDTDLERLKSIIQKKIQEAETQKSASVHGDPFLDSLKMSVQIAKEQSKVDGVPALESGEKPKKSKKKKQARQ